ncbi:MAG: carbamoyltransferase HypF [Proteobacteria bacterium]|nr:carbamoyltransferase HypF [Pseudomonadota bacterium]
MTVRRAGCIRGTVQGVGLRPLVAKLAAELSLGGRVRNARDGVQIEIEGTRTDLERFDRRLRGELPAAARVQDIRWREVAAIGQRDFQIAPSDQTTPVDPVKPAPAFGIPPDLAVCDECIAEVDDEASRRHSYPFTNCTACGPRFTITRSAPYDRERTSMQSFSMCGDCAREYDDPHDRRYHAQPIACPRCGPTLRLLAADASRLGTGRQALEAAVRVLRRGRIVALKGLGGYQLVARADEEATVARLRSRKRRPGKPLAVLVADLEAARRLAYINEEQARALRHRAAPIVLAKQRGTGVATAVAPGQRRLGLMLPATPLHLLIARQARVPLICTSGNLHEEPICIGDAEALERLAAVADVFLVHDRTIVRRADDSVVQIVCGRMRTLRAARGLRPLSLDFNGAERPVLALGGHLKQAAVLASNRRAVLWPETGDLHTAPARDAMVASIRDLEQYLSMRAAVIATDLHPDYATSIWAEASGRPVVRVQHHHAHIAAVLAEHRHKAALGFAWDGTGLGRDGHVWGGEAIAVDPSGARRVAHLRPFPLPGADAAARDGRRALAGLFVSAGVTPPAARRELARFAQVAASARLAQQTTSVGRLFDAVAALTGVAERSRFEGEAAMALEALAEPSAPPYPFTLAGSSIDWRPMLAAMLSERRDAVRVASRFHATLASMVLRVSQRHAAGVVVLSGGCFQNELLLRQSVALLDEHDVRTLIGEQVPPGDGGLALGQAWVANSSSACA